MGEAALDFELLARLVAACVLGAAVGFERERQGQAAGIRTHALVATGAALFTVIGAVGVVGHEAGANTDPLRVAAQVVTGIGFIGGGVILRDGGSVRGITTAAAVWASGALGVACGAGQLPLAVAGAVTVLVSLIFLRMLRDHGLSRVLNQHHVVVLTYKRGHGTLGPLVSAVERAGAKVESLAIEDDDARRRVELRVRARSATVLSEELATLSLPEIEHLAIDRRLR